jgi:uncharacterized DUF497 family protein
VKIVWDEPKRLANLDTHDLDLDFRDLDIAYFEGSVAVPAGTDVSQRSGDWAGRL